MQPEVDLNMYVEHLLSYAVVWRTSRSASGNVFIYVPCRMMKSR